LTERQSHSHEEIRLDIKRCAWPLSSDLMVAYHDVEWGVPVHDDRKLFEFMVLDAFQAGLSWSTILNKRENFRQAFDDFEPHKVARYARRRIERLLADPGIVRNRLKVEATVSNARAFLRIQEEIGSFDPFIWQFVGGETRQNRWRSLRQLPAKTKQSDAMSKALKERGFKFVGSTICYAFMQAAGMVNDHIVSCFRYKELGGRA
jgi:DNA-3-methyladenine glycosylase I